MRSRVSGLISLLPFNARDTVATETPAMRAMSAICGRGGWTGAASAGSLARAGRRGIGMTADLGTRGRGGLAIRIMPEARAAPASRRIALLRVAKHDMHRQAS